MFFKKLRTERQLVATALLFACLVTIIAVVVVILALTFKPVRVFIHEFVPGPPTHPTQITPKPTPTPTPTPSSKRVLVFPRSNTIRVSPTSGSTHKFAPRVTSRASHSATSAHKKAHKHKKH